MAAFSDNFDGTSLDARWVLRDPLGDVGFSVLDGDLLIASPAGVKHDFWTTNNDAGKCVQPVPDADFEVVLHINSLPANDGEGVGFAIEQDTTAANSLRIGVYSTGSGSVIALFSRPTTVWTNETITGAITGSDIWLKLKRVGDTFTFSWSNDGETYTILTDGVQTIVGFVTNHIGMYTRNAVSPYAAFTGLFDSIEFASDPFGSDPDLLETLIGITP